MKAVFFSFFLVLSFVGTIHAQNRSDGNFLNEAIRSLQGKMSFQIYQYDGNKIKEKHAVNVSGKTGLYTGNLNIDGSRWKCAVINGATAEDGSSDLKVTFSLEKGSLSSAGVAVAFDFNKWSEKNYLLIPAAVYNGNRFRVVNSGYMAPYPKSDYGNKHASLLFSDCPRLSFEPGKASKIELLTGNASTPGICFFSPGLQRGFILLTDQKTRFGNSGMFVEENAGRNEARFIISAPGVRERIADFGRFRNSGDSGADWKGGDEIVLHFRLYSFPAGSVPSLLKKFMAVRKSFTGPNHPNNIVPFSAVTHFTTDFEDAQRWYEDSTGSFYRSSNNNIFQLGWAGGLQNTFPHLALGDSLHRDHVFKNINLVVSKMQGKSGYFFGFFDHDNFLSDRDSIPNAAMVRKNSDVLFWLVKHFLLLKAQGGDVLIKHEWEQAAKKLARAFVKTWKENGQFGQYVNPVTGKVIIFNSTAGAIAPAGLALASVYFHKPEYLEVAKASAMYFYNQYVIKLGLTGGCCGDILQDADAETAFGLLESMMALYFTTGDKQWLSRAKVEADLCATWTLSYDEEFPPGSTLNTLHAHVAGAVFASVQNKHAAPGICTSSGDYLFKLYRATGDRCYADLLRDIVHAHAEVMEIPGRHTTGMAPGSSMERIQPTDADGEEAIGQILHSSNTWTETNGMLMALEIPSVYLRMDKNEMYIFDAIKVETIKRDAGGVTLRISNPCRFGASVSIFSENGQQAERPLRYTAFLKWPKIGIQPGETKTILIKRQNHQYKIVELKS